MLVKTKKENSEIMQPVTKLLKFVIHLPTLGNFGNYNHIILRPTIYVVSKHYTLTLQVYNLL